MGGFSRRCRKREIRERGDHGRRSSYWPVSEDGRAEKLCFREEGWYLEDDVAFRMAGNQSAEQGARANVRDCHASCRATSRANPSRGSSLTLAVNEPRESDWKKF